MRLRTWLFTGGIVLWLGGLGWLVLHSTPAAPPAPELLEQEASGAQWLKTAAAAGNWVGNEACRNCHPQQFNSHSKTPHARTVRPLPPGESRPEFQKTASVRDEQHGIEYTVRVENGTHYIVAAAGGKTTQGAPGWVFGTGTHSWAYLSREPKGFREYRISYYPKTKEWNFTPGQGPADPVRDPLGKTHTDLSVASCFGCHSTVLVGTKERLDLENSRLNIGCESCHGPGKAHVESANQYAAAMRAGGGTPPPLNSLALPAKLTGERQVKMCSQCHRNPTDVPDGDPRLEGQLARFAGAALMRSRCFQESGRELSCSSCHNPHEPASRSLAHYDAACGKCHSGNRGTTTCRAGRTSQCVSCHLPEQKIARKLPLNFHNHWIRAVIPEEERAGTQMKTPPP